MPKTTRAIPSAYMMALKSAGYRDLQPRQLRWLAPLFKMTVGQCQSYLRDHPQLIEEVANGILECKFIRGQLKFNVCRHCKYSVDAVAWQFEEMGKHCTWLCDSVDPGVECEDDCHHHLGRWLTADRARALSSSGGGDEDQGDEGGVEDHEVIVIEDDVADFDQP